MTGVPPRTGATPKTRTDFAGSASATETSTHSTKGPATPLPESAPVVFTTQPDHTASGAGTFIMEVPLIKLAEVRFHFKVFSMILAGIKFASYALTCPFFSSLRLQHFGNRPGLLRG